MGLMPHLTSSLCQILAHMHANRLDRLNAAAKRTMYRRQAASGGRLDIALKSSTADAALRTASKVSKKDRDAAAIEPKLFELGQHLSLIDRA